MPSVYIKRAEKPPAAVFRFKLGYRETDIGNYAVAETYLFKRQENAYQLFKLIVKAMPYIAEVHNKPPFI